MTSFPLDVRPWPARIVESASRYEESFNHNRHFDLIPSHCRLHRPQASAVIGLEPLVELLLVPAQLARSVNTPRALHLVEVSWSVSGIKDERYSAKLDRKSAYL